MVCMIQKCCSQCFLFLCDLTSASFAPLTSHAAPVIQDPIPLLCQYSTSVHLLPRIRMSAQNHRGGGRSLQSGRAFIQPINCEGEKNGWANRIRLLRSRTESNSLPHFLQSIPGMESWGPPGAGGMLGIHQMVSQGFRVLGFQVISGGVTLPEPPTWNTGVKAGGVGRVGWGCCLPCPKKPHFTLAQLFGGVGWDRSVSEVWMVFLWLGERRRLWRASTVATQTSEKSSMGLCWCVPTMRTQMPPSVHDVSMSA